MREIQVRTDGGGPGRPREDRRWLVVALLALLVFGGGIALRLVRVPEERPLEVGTSFETPAPPPARPPAERGPSPAPIADAERGPTVSEFLTTLTGGASREAGERFVQAFARRPALRRALIEFRREHGQDPPARELIRALYAEPEFGGLLAELRRDPELSASFDRLSRDALVSRALRGTMSAPRAGEGPASPPGEGPAGSGDGGGSGDGSAPPPGPGAHGATPLGRIKTDVGERAARKFVLSALASMPKEELKELEEACDRHDFCEPVQACQITGLWDSCVKACRRSGKCPPELAGPASGGD